MMKPVIAILVGTTVLSYIGLLFLAISFCAPAWLNFNVDNSGITTTFAASSGHPELFYSRERGLFQTCFTKTPPDDISSVLKLYQPSLTIEAFAGMWCVTDPTLSLSTTLPNFTNTDNLQALSAENAFRTRTHLLRLHIALFVIGMFLSSVGSGLGVYSAKSRESRYVYAAGGIDVAAAVIVGIAIAVFLIYFLLLEGQQITIDKGIFPFPAFLAKSQDYSVFQQNGVPQLHYAFILACISFILILASAIMYILMGRVVKKMQELEAQEPERTALVPASSPANKDVENGSKPSTSSTPTSPTIPIQPSQPINNFPPRPLGVVSSPLPVFQRRPAPLYTRRPIPVVRRSPQPPPALQFAIRRPAYDPSYLRGNMYRGYRPSPAGPYAGYDGYYHYQGNLTFR